ncbi:hypothetical protein [Lysinibacter sp. HNR]|uniref:hypothetical protein n=1 Tax=Lysinibacter sp. HNR TaxID=3031408 RepID=UPI002435C68B|nr:hypothetical protein [Lysinibacter sp. HNR]WGD38541.1 hypothetical protein FrondiHNR_06450 [Lysinibacter sp. HNR]
MNKKVLFQGVTTAVAVFALIASTTTAAKASSNISEEVALLIDRVAPDQGEVSQLSTNRSFYEGAGVNIPVDPTGTIQISGGGERGST